MIAGSVQVRAMGYATDGRVTVLVRSGGGAAAALTLLPE